MRAVRMSAGVLMAMTGWALYACSSSDVSPDSDAAGDIDAGQDAGDQGKTNVPKGEPAHLAFTQLAYYQTTKTELMRDGDVAPPPKKPHMSVPFIAGKNAMLRAFVDVSAGWKRREIIARLELDDGTMIESKPLMVVADSKDPTLASTLNLDLPAENLTTKTQIAVSLLESDGKPLMDQGVAVRWPAEGFFKLKAKKPASSFKLMVVPYQWPGKDAPKIDIQIWKDFAYSVYPMAEFDFEVHEPVPYDTTWAVGGGASGPFLYATCVLRGSEEKDQSRHWYGVVEPDASVMGSASGLGNIAGPMDTYARCAVGLGYYFSGAGTGIHELGHTFGRQHAPCGLPPGDGDPDYPYGDHMGQSAPIDRWGYSVGLGMDKTVANGQLVPPEIPDIMSYCQGNATFMFPFMSDYNFVAVWTRLQSYAGVMAYDPLHLSQDVQVSAQHDVISVSADGSARWMGQMPWTVGSSAGEVVSLLDGRGAIVGISRAIWQPTEREGVGAWMIPASGAAAVLLPNNGTPVSLSKK